MKCFSRNLCKAYTQHNKSIQMSTLNNCDLPSGSHRVAINKFKKDKGVKHIKDKKFKDQEFWKRARNIRFQKQSREDNFAGETDMFPEEDYPTTTKAVPACVVFTENPWGGRQEKIEVYMYDANRRIPDNDRGHTYGALTEDTLTIGTNGSSNILTAVVGIENVLRSNGIAFHFENNGAFWECQSDNHFFFLRLWLVENDVLVLEPIVGIGEPDAFRDYYYNTLFVPFWFIA